MVYAYEESTIEEVNVIRRKLDLNELKLNEKLNDAALSHSQYMVFNNSFSSIEEKGKKQYKGRYSWDRTSYFNYFNPYVSEFISRNIDKQDICHYLYNPYTRIIWLDPIYKDIGMAAHEGMSTYILGGAARDNNSTVIYPYDGQVLPYHWTQNQSVDAYKDLNIKRTDIGLPITISHYTDGKKIKRFVVNTVEIIDKATNQTIPYEVMKPSNNKYLNNTVVILPTQAYTPDTQYQFKIDIHIHFDNHKTEKVVYEGCFTVDKEILVTRLNIIESLIQILELPESRNSTYEFKDIDKSSSYAPYLYTALDNQLINGYPDKTFRPQSSMTKEAFYVVLIRAYEKVKGTIDITFKENIKNIYSVSFWARRSILKAEQLGLLDTEEFVKESKKPLTYSDYTKAMNQFSLLIQE